MKTKYNRDMIKRRQRKKRQTKSLWRDDRERDDRLEKEIMQDRDDREKMTE